MQPQPDLLHGCQTLREGMVDLITTAFKFLLSTKSGVSPITGCTARTAHGDWTALRMGKYKNGQLGALRCAHCIAGLGIAGWLLSGLRGLNMGAEHSVQSMLTPGLRAALDAICGPTALPFDHAAWDALLELPVSMHELNAREVVQALLPWCHNLGECVRAWWHCLLRGRR